MHFLTEQYSHNKVCLQHLYISLDSNVSTNNQLKTLVLLYSSVGRNLKFMLILRYCSVKGGDEALKRLKDQCVITVQSSDLRTDRQTDRHVKSSPEYISFLLVSLCHTYNQTMHILQKFVPLKSENVDRKRKIKTSFIIIIIKKHYSIIFYINLSRQATFYTCIVLYLYFYIPIFHFPNIATSQSKTF